MPSEAFPTPLVLLLLAVLPAGCVHRGRLHPVVEIQTEGGRELGVSTTDGILFLGATRREGRADAQLFFGDIPYQESGTILPAGGGLCRLDLEIRHPGVPISLAWPRPGEELLVLEIRDGRPRRHATRLASGGPALGEVYEFPSGLDPEAPPLGAGIFREGRRGELELVGLVKGSAILSAPGGDAPGIWLVPAGLGDLKEVLIARRPVQPDRELIHRPDLDRPVRRP